MIHSLPSPPLEGEGMGGGDVGAITMGRFLRNSRGMALILTILIISLIVALTLQFNTSMRSDLHAAANLRDGIKLGYIAKSGFNYVLAVLRLDDMSVDSLHDVWADSKSLSKNSAAQFDEGRFEVKVSDHSGRGFKSTNWLTRTEKTTMTTRKPSSRDFWNRLALRTKRRIIS